MVYLLHYIVVWYRIEQQSEPKEYMIDTVLCVGVDVIVLFYGYMGVILIDLFNLGVHVYA